MPFSRIDRNLMVRVAQALRERAEIIRVSHQPWTSAPESKKKKAEFDRHLRDAGDLDDLRRRMEREHPDMIKLMPVVPKPATGTGG